MPAVAAAYERKYGRTLSEALRSEISGNFLKASLAWIDSLAKPTLEAVTEQELTEETATLEVLDALLEERDAITTSLATLDAARIHKACAGFGTADCALIECVATRSKPHLQKVAKACVRRADTCPVHRGDAAAATPE